MSAYITPEPTEALRLADEALAAARLDYQRSDAQAARALALLRAGEPRAALAAAQEGERARLRSTQVLQEAVQGASPEAGDLGLHAQHVVLAAVAQLRAGDQRSAAETLSTALSDPRLSPFHEGVLRVFGEAAEAVADQSWKRHRRLRAVLGIGGAGTATPARLPDALVAAWRTRAAAQPVGR